MNKIIKFCIGVFLLYVFLFLIVRSYRGEIYNIAVEPIDYESHSNNSLFPCIEHPIRTIKIKPLEVGKIKDKLFLKMDWGVIDEKIYPAIRIMLYARYKVINPDTKSGALPSYYELSLNGINYKNVNDKDFIYIGSVRLNQENKLYAKTCLILVLMDKPNVKPTVRFLYSLQENTFYSTFKLLFNLTFWSSILWLCFKGVNIFMKKNQNTKH